ncbi:MAG: putative pre-16S rRNA nuclease [Chlamydiae bacterium]|nr:putative pre-16S rRNA nuclease [Chlamydiota bacterium]
MARPLPNKFLGIDYGMARIGLALSDERKIIASPLFTLTTESKLEQTVEKLLIEIEKHQQEHGYVIDTIVVGLPLLMSGKEGLIADEVNHFVGLLKKSLSIPIQTWDERLTSVLAERTLRESNLSRKKRTKFVDTVSAVIILQNYLDMKSLQQDLS